MSAPPVDREVTVCVSTPCGVSNQMLRSGRHVDAGARPPGCRSVEVVRPAGHWQHGGGSRDGAGRAYIRLEPHHHQHTGACIIFCRSTRLRPCLYDPWDRLQCIYSHHERPGCGALPTQSSHAQIGFSDDMLLLSPRKQKRLHVNLKKAGDAAADALRRQVYGGWTSKATCYISNNTCIALVPTSTAPAASQMSAVFSLSFFRAGGWGQAGRGSACAQTSALSQTPCGPATAICSATTSTQCWRHSM
jgi:hypothetical protein